MQLQFIVSHIFYCLHQLRQYNCSMPTMRHCTALLTTVLHNDKFSYKTTEEDGGLDLYIIGELLIAAV